MEKTSNGNLTSNEDKDKASNLKKLEMEDCSDELCLKRNQLTQNKLEQFVTVGEQLVYEEELERLRESIKLTNSEIELKERKVQLLNNQITVCGQALERKSKEMGEILKLIEEKTRELGVMHDQRDLLKLCIHEVSEKVLAEVERHKKILLAVGKISSEMEERSKEIKAAETKASELNARSQILRQDVKYNEKKLDFLTQQIEFGERKLVQLKREIEESGREIKAAESEASDLSVKSARFWQEVKGKERELHLLKNYRWAEEQKLTQLKREMEKENKRRKKDLEVILSKIQESGKQLVTVDEQLESQQKLLDTQSMELVSKNMELKSVAVSSERLKVDLEEKEKNLHTLKNLITISSEQLDLKSKELGEVQKLIEEQTKKLCDMQPRAAASISDTSQQNAAVAEPVDEDVLLHHESSESLVPDEVSIALRASPNPAEFVLDLVQEQIKEGLGLEDSVVEILVLLLDELAKIQRLEKSQLQIRATEVAHLWKGKITIKAPKSSLESLAFLLFIVAYGLEKLVNQEETVLLASSISHYKQAPTLFNSLGLKPEMIPEIVSELIKQSHYIPAVRFICHFQLTKNFPPSDLLMVEITNLRRSVLEKRPTGSSQAKDKDAGRLRDILEVVADYELKIDLPGDLVAKLMVQRENSTSPVYCSVTHLTSSSNPQASYPDQSSVNLGAPKAEVKPYI